MNSHLAEGHRARQVVVDPLAELGDDLRVGVRVKRLALLHLRVTQRYSVARKILKAQQDVLS